MFCLVLFVGGFFVWFLVLVLFCFWIHCSCRCNQMLELLLPIHVWAWLIHTDLVCPDCSGGCIPKAWFPFKLGPDLLLWSYKVAMEKSLSRKKNWTLYKLKAPICQVANPRHYSHLYKTCFLQSSRNFVNIAKRHFLKGFNAQFIANLIFVFACSPASS